MKLKESIQQDFILAMKSRDEVGKSALSSIKAKITEAEKANGNIELEDSEVIKVISKGIKQREESAKIYLDNDKLELFKKEVEEADVLRKYMPAKMSEIEIEKELRNIISGIDANGNAARLKGQAIGAFNKKFQGMADIEIVKNIIEKII